MAFTTLKNKRMGGPGEWRITNTPMVPFVHKKGALLPTPLKFSSQEKAVKFINRYMDDCLAYPSVVRRDGRTCMKQHWVVRSRFGRIRGSEGAVSSIRDGHVFCAKDKEGDFARTQCARCASWYFVKMSCDEILVQRVLSR